MVNGTCGKISCGCNSTTQAKPSRQTRGSTPGTSSTRNADPATPGICSTRPIRKLSSTANFEKSNRTDWSNTTHRYPARTKTVAGTSSDHSNRIERRPSLICEVTGNDGPLISRSGKTLNMLFLAARLGSVVGVLLLPTAGLGFTTLPTAGFGWLLSTAVMEIVCVSLAAACGRGATCTAEAAVGGAALLAVVAPAAAGFVSGGGFGVVSATTAGCFVFFTVAFGAAATVFIFGLALVLTTGDTGFAVTAAAAVGKSTTTLVPAVKAFGCSPAGSAKTNSRSDLSAATSRSFTSAGSFRRRPWRSNRAPRAKLKRA